MRRSIIALAATLLLLAGCGQKQVDSDQLEEQVASRLTKTLGGQPDEVDCPEALPAKKGEKVECTLAAKDVEYSLALTATAVDGSDVKFDIDPTPTAVGKKRLSDQVAKALTREVGQAPDSVVCPEKLLGKKGDTVKCELKAGETELGLTVETTTVDDDINFTIQVDQPTS